MNILYVTYQYDFMIYRHTYVRTVEVTYVDKKIKPLILLLYLQVQYSNGLKINYLIQVRTYVVRMVSS